MNDKFVQLANYFLIPFIYVALLWILLLWSYLSGTEMMYWGVLPRYVSGLKGILTSPLAHSGIEHLFSNSIPLIFLGAGLLWGYSKKAIPVFVIIYIFSGVGTWLIGRTSYHIGSSGIVYGLAAFLIWSGVIRRDIKSIAVSLTVFFVYGGLVAGLAPNQDGISWEGHLSGFIVGIALSYWNKRVPKKELEDDDDENYSYRKRKKSSFSISVPEYFKRNKKYKIKD